MDKLIMLYDTTPWMKWVIIIYAIYHTIGFVLLSPLLWSEHGPLKTCIFFPLSYIPGTKTLFKLNSWGLLKLVPKIITLFWLYILPFAIGAFIFPKTSVLYLLAMALFLLVVTISMIVFGVKYDYNTVRNMFFPTEDDIEDPLNDLYENENIRTSSLNQLLGTLSLEGLSKEDAKEIILTSTVFSKPRRSPFKENEIREITDFILEHTGFSEEKENIEEKEIEEN